MKLYESSVILLEYDEKTRLMTQTWKGYATSEQFRQSIDKTFELFVKNKPLTLIVDARGGAVVKKEDTDYAAQTGMKLVQNGLKAQAFIVPTNAFIQLSVNNFVSQTSNEYVMQYFDDIAKAKEWLLSYAA